MVEHLTEEPTDEPVSLDEAKKQIALDTDEDDDFVSTLISAARRHVEAHCNRGIMQQTWEAVLDAFPTSGCAGYQYHTCWAFSRYDARGPCKACHLYIELPHGQLADLDGDPAVESIKYIDLSGNEQTMPTTDYSIDDVSVPGRVHLAYGKSWPQTRKQWNAVKITYTVGWTIDTVPESIKQGVLLLVSQMYEKRTPELDSVSLGPAGEALLSPHRIITL